MVRRGSGQPHRIFQAVGAAADHQVHHAYQRHQAERALSSREPRTDGGDDDAVDGSGMALNSRRTPEPSGTSVWELSSARKEDCCNRGWRVASKR